jgi:two-component system cell cycle response regulator CtrA
MRVLLVEDDALMARSIELMLRSRGIVCDRTDLGEDGLEIGKLYDYDIIVLDLVLPDLDGQEVVKRLRASGVTTPVLILSGLAETEHKIQGFQHGADDYLTKPFDKEELVARLQAVIRRSKGHAESVIRVGRLSVDLNAHGAFADGTRLDLTAKEYKVLELLCLRKGATLTKEMFLNHLYGGIDEPEQKIIDVFICKLRRKLKTALDGQDYIETVWGRGYALRDVPEPVPPEGAAIHPVAAAG